MGQIPLGNFGNAVANVGPTVQVPRGNPIGQAVERVGQIAQAGVQAQVDAKMREQQQAEAQALREFQAKEAEAERERAEVAAANERAKTITALTGTKDALEDLYDQYREGVLAGTVDKGKAEAEFGAAARKLYEGAGADLPEHRRAILQAELSADASRRGDDVRKAVTQRGRQEVSSGIAQTLEYLQREYKRNPEAATKQAMATIDALGPASTLGPEQLAKVKQQWLEGTQYTAAYELVSAGRDNRKALDAAERAIHDGLPDVDPQKRATLLDRIANYRMHIDQKAEIAAQRAQRQAEAHLKRAEATFSAATALADKGVLNADFADATLGKLKGTPFAQAFAGLVTQQKEVGSLASRPIAAQRQELDALNAMIARDGITPQLERRRNQLQSVVLGSEGDLKKDPMRAGLERGVIDSMPAIDSSKGFMGMLEGIRQRVGHADTVRAWAGRPVSPLSADEAETLGSHLKQLPAKDRAGALVALSQAMPPEQAQALAQQIDAKDKATALALAKSSSKTTEGRFISELILLGADAKRDGTSTKGDKAPDIKANKWKAFAANELAGVFPNAQHAEKVRDAAELIMHGIAAEAGGRLDDDDMRRAVRLAVGGSIIEHAGRKIPMPAGKSDEDLRAALGNGAAIAAQAPGGVVRVGGVEMQVADFAKSLPGQALVAVRPGTFAVEAGGRYVTNSAGKPILITIR